MEVVVAYLKILFRNLYGMNEENSRDRKFLGSHGVE
jgi:hypothetical protein